MPAVRCLRAVAPEPPPHLLAPAAHVAEARVDERYEAVDGGVAAPDGTEGGAQQPLRVEEGAHVLVCAAGAAAERGSGEVGEQRRRVHSGTDRP
jgi:hypothetical protein